MCVYTHARVCIYNPVSIFKIQEIFRERERERVPNYQCNVKVREVKKEEEEKGFKLS